VIALRRRALRPVRFAQRMHIEQNGEASELIKNLELATPKVRDLLEARSLDRSRFPRAVPRHADRKKMACVEDFLLLLKRLISAGFGEDAECGRLHRPSPCGEARRWNAVARRLENSGLVVPRCFL